MAGDPSNHGKTDDLRRRAEEVLAAGDRSAWKHSSDVVDLIKELEIHQTELQLQNDSLREAQADLSALHREYADLYEFAPCGYVTVNADLLISRANLTAVRMLGAERTAIVRSDLREYLSKRGREAYRRALRECAASGEEQHAELELVTSPGQYRWAHADITTAERGEGFLVTLTDITDRVYAEAQLERRQREVEQLVEEKELLIHEVHHRIKNDLHLVRAFLQIQISQSESSEAKEALRRATDRVAVVASVYSHLYQGEQIKEVGVRELVGRLSTDLEQAYFRDAARIDVDIEDVRVEPGVSVSLGLIVNELLTNAAKYAFPAAGADDDRLDGRSAGEMRVHVAVRRPSPGRLELEVSDNGVGLPDSVVEGRGYGFGLQTVRSLAAQHRGSVEIRNNGGATVVVSMETGISEDSLDG